MTQQAEEQAGDDRGGGKPRRRFIVFFSLALLFCNFVIMIGAYHLLQSNLRSELRQQQRGVELLLGELVSQRGELMAAICERLASDRSLQAAMLRGDRVALYQLSVPVYRKLVDDHGITHFYFHDPQGVNILRVHHPAFYGDHIKRFTLRRSMKIGRYSSGIELGPLGTFTLRTVFPWYVNGRLIGYIELGEEIDHLLGEIREISRSPLFVTIRKSYLDRGSWETGMRMLGRVPQWDLLPEDVLMGGEPTGVGRALVPLLAGNEVRYLDEVALDYSGRRFRGAVLPLKDAADREVGNLIVLHDVTARITRFHWVMAAIAMVALFLWGTVVFVVSSCCAGEDP